MVRVPEQKPADTSVRCLFPVPSGTVETGKQQQQYVAPFPTIYGPLCPKQNKYARTLTRLRLQLPSTGDKMTLNKVGRRCTKQRCAQNTNTPREEENKSISTTLHSGQLATSARRRRIASFALAFFPLPHQSSSCLLAESLYILSSSTTNGHYFLSRGRKTKIRQT